MCVHNAVGHLPSQLPPLPLHVPPPLPVLFLVPRQCSAPLHCLATLLLPLSHRDSGRSRTLVIQLFSSDDAGLLGPTSEGARRTLHTSGIGEPQLELASSRGRPGAAPAVLGKKGCHAPQHEKKRREGETFWQGFVSLNSDSSDNKCLFAAENVDETNITA